MTSTHHLWGRFMPIPFSSSFWSSCRLYARNYASSELEYLAGLPIRNLVFSWPIVVSEVPSDACSLVLADTFRYFGQFQVLLFLA